MKVVLDTNVLIVSIPDRSKFRPIWDAYLNNNITLIVTTDIYFEYIEMLYTLSKKVVAEFVGESLKAAVNIINPAIYYSWNLITADPDDNKFTDAYIAANAIYLVTNDAHFNEAKKTPFPPVNIISADDFLKVLQNM